MKRVISWIVVIGLYMVALFQTEHIMPIWQCIIPGILSLILIKKTYTWSAKIAVLLGVILLFFSFLPFFSEEEGEVLVVHSKQHTYVIHNKCFLYCNPVVYKKYPYLPFTKFYKELGEQAVISHRVEGDLVYLEDGIREWVLGEEDER